MKKLILFFLLLGTIGVKANNVIISNVSVINGGPGNIVVKFDLSWENSWRFNIGPANYDGVWVFFKYRTAGGDWKHITQTGDDNLIPAGVDVYQTNDFLKVGAIIHREAANTGAGTMTVTNIRLGVLNTLPYDIEVRGFAVEMVYIPAPTVRPFFGDGDGVTESLNALHYTDNTATTSSVVPMKVDVNGFDDGELEGVVNSTGIYVYSNDTIQETVPLGTLDPFPTMKAFWCMKYEITQAAYRDFLNTLTYTQQAARTASAPNAAIGTGALGATARHALEIRTPGVASTTPAVYGCDMNSNNVYDEAGDGEWVACGFITWPDLAAFMDWSGLGPMSELQFERACRGSSSAGPNAAILGEYAWGNATIFGAPYTLTGPGTASELASNASTTLGNGAYAATSGSGALRNGIFATSTSNRMISGATFYGVMEMSGNLTEYCITLGNNAGRSCRFVPNGNGNLSAAGNAQLSVGGAGFWPGMEGNTNSTANNTCAGTCEVTQSAGMMLRGGSFNDPDTELRISERGAFTPTARTENRGGRGILNIR